MSRGIITTGTEVLRVNRVIATAIDVPHLGTRPVNCHIRPGIIIELSCDRNVLADPKLSIGQTVIAASHDVQCARAWAVDREVVNAVAVEVARK